MSLKDVAIFARTKQLSEAMSLFANDIRYVTFDLKLFKDTIT